MSDSTKGNGRTITLTDLSGDPVTIPLDEIRRVFGGATLDDSQVLIGPPHDCWWRRFKNSPTEIDRLIAEAKGKNNNHNYSPVGYGYDPRLLGGRANASPAFAAKDAPPIAEPVEEWPRATFQPKRLNEIDQREALERFEAMERKIAELETLLAQDLIPSQGKIEARLAAIEARISEIDRSLVETRAQVCNLIARIEAMEGKLDAREDLSDEDFDATDFNHHAPGKVIGTVKIGPFKPPAEMSPKFDAALRTRIAELEAERQNTEARIENVTHDAISAVNILRAAISPTPINWTGVVGACHDAAKRIADLEAERAAAVIDARRLTEEEKSVIRSAIDQIQTAGSSNYPTMLKAKLAGILEARS